ncbi:MAG: alanine racemase [Elusimicrobiota bacterium]
MNFSRPVWVEVDLKNLRHNIRAVKKFVCLQKKSPKILAVVKTDAYGHGLLPVSKVCVEEKLDFLGVTSVEEGIALRKEGIDVPVLLLGTLFPFDSFAEVIAYDLIPTVASVSGVISLNEYAKKYSKKYPFHLKVDTGMGRIGISPSSTRAFLKQLSSLEYVKIEGVFTHFSSADSEPEYTARQFSLFKNVMDEVKKSGVIYHCANSAAMLKYPVSHLSMVRPGLCLYGLKPFKTSEKFIKTKPVLSWKAQIVFIKKVPKGNFISYDRTFVTKKDSVIATVPVGYGDGFRRSLSNKGVAIIRGIKVPVVGRVTMDMTMFDVTKVKGCSVGDTVELINAEGGLPTEEIASLSGTNNYETVCGIHPRVKRIYLNV